MAAKKEEFIDEYGFPHDLSKAQRQRLKIRQWTAANQWSARFASVQAALAAPLGELQSLAATHGIAPNYRADLWWHAAGKQYAQRYSNAATYAAMVEQSKGISIDVARQIELDLPRTFPEQVDFAAALLSTGTVFDGSRSSIAEAMEAGVEMGDVGTGSVHGAVRRMLRAFVVLHPDIGYLQASSMNFVAAFVLLVFGRAREEYAFWQFAQLTSHQLAGYYTGDMAMLRVDCEVFRAAMQQRLPHLCVHLDDIGLAEVSSLFLPRWLLCTYLNCFAADVTVRIWDVMMLERDSCEAPRVLLEVGLAILRVVQPDLMAARNFADAAEVLRTVGSRVVDAAELLMLSRSPECSLSNMPLAQWRKVHGGPMHAQAMKEHAAAAAAASATASASAVAIAQQPAPSSSSSSSVDAGADLELCQALGVAPPVTSSSSSSSAAASSSSVVTSPAAGRKRRRGSEEGASASDGGITSPSAAAAAAGGVRMAPPTLRRTRSMYRPPAAAGASSSSSSAAAGVVVASPPPVDINSSLERVFSPICESPSAAACASPSQAFDMQRSPASKMKAIAAATALLAGAAGSPIPISMTSPPAAVPSPRRLLSPRGGGSATSAVGVMSPMTRSRMASAAGAGAAPASRSLLASPRGYRCGSPASSSAAAAAARMRSPVLVGPSSARPLPANNAAGIAGSNGAAPYKQMDLLTSDEAASPAAVASACVARPPSASLAASGIGAVGRPRGSSVSLNSSFIGASSSSSVSLLPPTTTAGAAAAAAGGGAASKRHRSSSLASTGSDLLALDELSPVAAPRGVTSSRLAACLNPSVAAASARKAARASAKKPPRTFAASGTTFSSSAIGHPSTAAAAGSATASSISSSGRLNSSFSGVEGALSMIGGPSAGSFAASAAAAGRQALSASASGFSAAVGSRLSSLRHSTAYSEYDADASAQAQEATASAELPLEYFGYRSQSGISSLNSSAANASFLHHVDDDDEDDEDSDDYEDENARSGREGAKATAAGAGGSAGKRASAQDGPAAKRMRMHEFVKSGAVQEMQPLSSSSSRSSSNIRAGQAAAKAVGHSGNSAGRGGGQAMQLMMLSPPRRAGTRSSSSARDIG